MSEFDEQPEGGISRRTVTKAMAWAVPVIAIAAPAPAFAVSGGILEFAGVGCKLPGNSNSIYKGYAFLLSVTNNTNAAVTIDVQSITLDGNSLGQIRSVNLDTGNIQGDPFLVPADFSAPNVALLTEFAPNSQNGILEVKYTINGGAVQTITVSVPSAPPINGASCDAFTTAQKITINQSIGGVPAWTPTTAYEIGDTVSVAGGFLTAIVAGTSGGTEPVLPAAPQGTVVDGTVTWQRP